MEDIKKLEEGNDIIPLRGVVFKQENGQILKENGRFVVDRDKQGPLLGYKVYDDEKKFNDYFMERQYDFDKERNFKSYGFSLYKENSESEGIYEAYVKLKKEFEQIYGEPTYLYGGEEDWQQEHKTSDKTQWSKLIGDEKLSLNSHFAAQNTEIRIYVAGREGKAFIMVIFTQNNDKDDLKE
jgi:hypothetical protein